MPAEYATRCNLTAHLKSFALTLDMSIEQNQDRPAASFDATYSTYEQMNPRVPLPKHTVDIQIEGFMMLEVGGWGTMIKIRCAEGTKVSVSNDKPWPVVYFTPPPKSKSSLHDINSLAKSLKPIVDALSPSAKYNFG